MPDKDENTVVYNPEEEAILPDGWDGTTGFIDESQTEEEAPTTEPATEEATTEEVTEEQGTEGETETPTTEPEQDTTLIPKPKIKVKFNHEEKELDLDEAAVYAQKGMNYDRIAPAWEDANKLAKQMGYSSASDMINAAKENYFKAEVEKMVEEGVHESVAASTVKQIIAEREHESEAQQAAEVAKSQAEQQEQIRIARNRDVDDFVRTYPGITTLPEDVKAMNNSGVPLVVAYAQWKATQAENELKILKQNQSAAARAPIGSATKHGATGTKAKDAFEEGFDSDAW